MAVHLLTGVRNDSATNLALAFSYTKSATLVISTCQQSSLVPEPASQGTYKELHL